MKKLLLFLGLGLLVQPFSVQAKPIENSVSCPLPPPGWINATDITENSITIEWESDGGAVWYKVTRFDVTNGIALPDVFVPGSTNTYTSTPHAAGTTIQFGVSATSCDTQAIDQYGEETTALLTTTWIVVDVIASFSAPGTPSGNYQILPNGPSGSTDVPISVINADEGTPLVRVTKTKVKFTDKHGVVRYAEFLTWSHCSNPESSAIRVMYWNKSSWPAGVTCTPLSGSTSLITFNLNGGPFFKLYLPSFASNNGQLKIHNDMPGSIFYDQWAGQETNPCYVAEYGENGGEDESNEAFSEVLNVENRDAIHAISENIALNVNPNPFSNGFTVNYALDAESPLTLALFDYTGRQVKTMQLPTLDAGNYSTSIYTNDLPAGIYQLSFQTNQARLMTTLVKHN